jgi:hypothetical protein
MKNIELVMEFIESEVVYEIFQQWLEKEKDIPGSEAEYILNNLETRDKQPLFLKGEVLDRKFSFIATNRANGKSFTEADGVLLLAKDDLVPATLEFYLSLVRREKGVQCIEAQGLVQLIERVAKWRETNADLCKLPDITGEKERIQILGK